MYPLLALSDAILVLRTPGQVARSQVFKLSAKLREVILSGRHHMGIVSCLFVMDLEWLLPKLLKFPPQYLH